MVRFYGVLLYDQSICALIIPYLGCHTTHLYISYLIALYTCMYLDSVHVSHCTFPMHISPGGDIIALLFDLPSMLTACTAMLVYTLFLSSPVKL